MRSKALFVALSVALLAGAIWAGYYFLIPKFVERPPPAKTESHPSTRIVAMPTNGGQFEIATVTSTETLERESSGKYRFLDGLFEVDLGTTYSRIRFTAVYRYHLKMAKVWTLELRPDKTCVVQTSSVDPTLPVAFDTATLERFTTSGWARFDKQDNLQALERTVTPALAALSRNHLALAMQTGRPVVEKWVRDWLLKYERDGESYKVIIVFAGEQPPAASRAP